MASEVFSNKLDEENKQLEENKNKQKNQNEFFDLPYQDAMEQNSGMLGSDDDEDKLTDNIDKLARVGEQGINKKNTTNQAQNRVNSLEPLNEECQKAMNKNISKKSPKNQVNSKSQQNVTPLIKRNTTPVSIEIKNDKQEEFIDEIVDETIPEPNTNKAKNTYKEDLKISPYEDHLSSDSDKLSKNKAFNKKPPQSPGLVQSNKKQKNVIMTPTSQSRKSSIDDSDPDSSVEHVRGARLIQEEENPSKILNFSGRRSYISKSKSSPISIDLTDTLSEDNQVHHKNKIEDLEETAISMSTHNSKKTSSKSGYIFTSDINHNVKQWNANDFSLKKKFQNIHNGQITAVVTSYDCKNLFTIEVNGFMKQWLVESSSQKHDWGKIHDDNKVYCLKMSQNGLYQFTGDDKGFMKQWSVELKYLYQNWGKIHDSTVLNINLGNDSQFMFTTANNCIKMWNQKSRNLLKSLENVHEGCIYSSKLSLDMRYQYTSDSKGYLKQWEILYQNETSNSVELKKDFGKIHNNQIRSLCVTPNSKILFSSDINGDQKMFSIENGEELNEYEGAHEDSILNMCISRDSKFQYSSDKSGNQKIWSVEGDRIIELYSIQEANGIWSMDITC